MLHANTIADIINNADESDLERVFEALKSRRKFLQDSIAAQLHEGQRVRLDRITPKALQGLRGTLRRDPTASARSKRWSVELDERSTNTLRHSPVRGVRVAPDDKNHLLTGIPAACIVPIGDAVTV